MSASLKLSCLTCKNRIAFQQGCCSACLWRHRADVKFGRTTWNDLVSRGLALAPHARNSRDKATILKLPQVDSNPLAREVRCLSIMQPWATLVVHGAKRYETRGWFTRHRGEIAIHVSRTFSMESRWHCHREPFRSVLATLGYEDDHVLPTGAVIGLADLVDCIPCEDLGSLDPRERAFGNFRRGRWAYRFDNPRVLPEPIPAKGNVGIFTLRLVI